MALIAHFKNRAHGTRLHPGINWTVESCSWTAAGGCAAAVLRSQVAGIDLDGLADLLRCGLELYDPGGCQLAWWGYVKALEVWDHETGARLDLGNLVNRLRVAFGFHAADLQGSGYRLDTAWADDLDSQATYGVKELQLYLDVTTSSQAEVLRTVELAARSKPRVQPLAREQGKQYELVLHGAGWWETLDWKHYSNAAGLVEYRTGGIGVNDMGDIAANTKIAQQFTTVEGGWRVDEAWALVRKVGAPVDYLQCTLCADNAGSPGTVLGTATAIAASAMAPDFSWEKWTFGTPYPITASTPYWLVFSRSGSLDSADHYRFRVNQALRYAGGVFRLFGGASWAARSPDADLLFAAAGTMETTRQVHNMVTAGGQFLVGARIDSPSGVYTNPYRYGDRTALEEIAAHLSTGDSSGRGLLGKVTPERYLVVSAKPPEAAGYLIGVGGELKSLTGARVPVFQANEVVGSWAVHDAAWRGLGTGSALVNELVCIEHIVYKKGRLRIVLPEG